MGNRTAGDHGYITVTVLLFAGFLAAVVSAVQAASLPTLGYARLSAQEAVAGSLLDAGLQVAGYALFAAKQDAESINGTVLDLGTGSSRIDVRDEAARVDLNAADEDLLAGLYAASGNRTLAPAVFAARVIDWRDEDSDESAGGAEEARYVVEGSMYAPRNAPFRTPADLAFVLGVTPEDAARLLPFTTVFNPGGGIDPLSASDVVLAALPDLSPTDLGVLVTARRAGIVDRAAIVESMSSPSRYLQRQPSGFYRIGIRARLPGGYTSSAEAVIAKPPGDKRDFGILAWARTYRD